MITFLSVVILDVEIGLGVGVAFYIIAHLVRSSQYVLIKVKFVVTNFNFRPYTTLLGNINETEIYKDIKLYKDVREAFIDLKIISI